MKSPVGFIYHKFSICNHMEYRLLMDSVIIMQNFHCKNVLHVMNMIVVFIVACFHYRAIP